MGKMFGKVKGLPPVSSRPMTECERHLASQQRYRFQKALSKMHPKAQQVMRQHEQLCLQGRIGLRGRLLHYILDRSLGVSRKSAWNNSAKWITIK